MMELKECTKKANIPCQCRLTRGFHAWCQAPPEVDCHYAEPREEESQASKLLKTYLLLGTIFRQGERHDRN